MRGMGRFAGLNGPGLRLACAEPGDQLAIFGEAPRELHDRAMCCMRKPGGIDFRLSPRSINWPKRCRASQRNCRNTLFFVAADAAGLATAREVMRKVLAWESIAKDDRVKGQITTAQVKNTGEHETTPRQGR